MKEKAEEYHELLMEAVADGDDELMEKCLSYGHVDNITSNFPKYCIDYLNARGL